MATPVSAPADSVDVALVQVASPDSESRDERIARVEALLLANPGADVYVLPELWSAGYFSFDAYDALAESLDGPTVAMGRRVAAALDAWIHLGSIVERDPSGRLHNTAVLIAPSGLVAQTYRKIHVFGYQSLESELLTPGETLSVVSSPLGATGSTTCYDLRFPGLWQELSDRGAEAVVVPAAWPAARREHWRLLTQARAVEHQLWVVAVNACGVQRGVELGGSSRIVDPSGRVLAECGADEEVLRCRIDVGLTAVVRAEFPVLGDRLDRSAYPGLSTASGEETA
ncbi:carbon-nitrogen family hydrolase [Leucobacter sp. CSA2]|uniref:Carbon-nitrogen family hydrolase n=1 Tax=Leucobacter edaphi TaxID=2796472 RepID=A0A934UWU9_9MICO|nr:carbon-nitrogen family hydrolase [Leucobacter edaphi]MBK0420648.1 carbon-nitrogen family hydrolase [Leucobacter edaphi]